MPTYGLYGAYIDGYFNDNPNYVIGKYPHSTEIRKNFTRYVWVDPSGTGLSEGEYRGETVQFTGYFTSSATGVHTFELGSDDAGYLWVGSTAETGFTVNNALVALPGYHGYYVSSASITLTQGVPYFIRLITGNGLGEEDNPGEFSLGYRLPGQSVYTYDATNSNVYTVQLPATPTPTPTPTLAGTATPTPTPTNSPTPTPTSTPTSTPIPPSGYFTRRNNQVTTYTNLTAVFAAYQGTRTKALSTGFSAAGVDLKDLLDPAISSAEKIDFNTGFFANGVDLKDIFRAQGILTTETPTPTPTTSSTPPPTFTPTPSPTPSQLPTLPPPPGPPPPPPSPPFISLTVNGTKSFGSTVNFTSIGNGNTQLINSHIIWERSGANLESLGNWVAHYQQHGINAFVSNLNSVGGFTFNFYGVYQFYSAIYTNNGLNGYGSGTQTYNISP